MSELFFTEEHHELRKMVRKFVKNELTPFVDEWEAKGEFPPSLFKRMGELGILGIHYPTEIGGQGADYLSSVVVFEELIRCGAGSVPMALGVHMGCATPPIHKFGTDEQKKKYLEPAISGEKIASLAITEPNAGSDVSGIKTTAVHNGKGWVLNGSKTFITNGVKSAFTVVVAKTDPTKPGAKGCSLFLVDKGTPGFEVSKKMDKVGMRSSDTAELFFDDCFLEDECLLGEVNKGFYHIMWELQGERIVGSAIYCSHAQLALEIGLQYMHDRVQFGQKLSEFQALRHRFADLAARLEAARHMTHNIAYRFGQGEYPVKEISMCKLVSSQVCCEICDFVLQMHGGYGLMMEYPIQRLWRDARLYRIGAGSDEIMKEIIAKEIGL